MPPAGIMVVFALGSILYLGVSSVAHKVNPPIKKISCKLIHKGCNNDTRTKDEVGRISR